MIQQDDATEDATVQIAPSQMLMEMDAFDTVLPSGDRITGWLHNKEEAKYRAISEGEFVVHYRTQKVETKKPTYSAAYEHDASYRDWGDEDANSDVAMGMGEDLGSDYGAEGGDGDEDGAE